ncbi:MAG: hypothetical protein IKA36_04715 [Clostridia bacterium]|nr:hypothetical protein [Clostridia bacterium]
MGKKSKILYFSILGVNLVCFILDLLPINFPFFRISFSVTMMLIGALLIARAVTLKLDSSMFLGIAFFLCGLLNGLLYFGGVYFGWSANEFWPYYIFAFSFASLCTAIYFKEKVMLKVFLLLLGFGAITLLYSLGIIKFWLMITLLIVWFVLYFTFNTLVHKKRSNNG